MKIAIPGGTGQVGTLLARAFHKDGHEVIVLGRRAPTPAPWRVEQWNPANVAEWADKVEGADVVINLAGRSVNCRYTGKNRQEILQSRVVSVRPWDKQSRALSVHRVCGLRQARPRFTPTPTLRRMTKSPA